MGWEWFGDDSNTLHLLFSSENLGNSILHGSDGKEYACNAGDLGSIPGWGRSPGEGSNTLQYSCLENSRDIGAWGGGGGYSPLGHKESDKTEQLTHMRIESANNLTGSRAQAVMQAMANDCAYRWSFTHSPTTHLLLCRLFPTRPWTRNSCSKLCRRFSKAGTSPYVSLRFSSLQLLSCVRLFAIPWTTAH